MTRTKALNMFVLQWFWIRLARICVRDGNGYRQQAWGLMGPVMPLTGWWTDYIGWPSVFFQWEAGS